VPLTVHTYTYKYIIDKVVTREVEKIKQVPVSVERLVPRQNVSLFFFFCYI
jgi:ribonucleotide reductase beta subunit family protein with ferritin-like domain